MAPELQRLITTLLPSSCPVRLTEVTLGQGSVRLQLTATALAAACLRCMASSSSIHSRYQCHLMDLPSGTRAVHLQLTVRKFFYRNPTCPRRMFTEPLPALVVDLRAIGIALGEQEGASLAACLRLPTSPATLLRLVRAAPMSQTSALHAVGVDEWTCRRGHRYGTILVNLADHRVLDLLPDRSATSVAAGLAQHPTLTVICRDRLDLYADGICRGAPDAVQVVGRFHLV